MPDFSAVLQPKSFRQPSWPATWKLPSLLFPNRSKSRKPKNVKRKGQLQSPKSLTALERSFSIVQSFDGLRRHRWHVSDLQYLVLAAVGIGCLYIIDIHAPLIKSAVVMAYAMLLLVPATQQFFLPSWPIWTYLLYFFSSRFIPNEVRPHIWVEVLPALENIMYGANLSNILSAHTHAVLDILAWLPYGLGHFSLPAICSGVIFTFAAPGTLPVFARCFGWMSLLGVTLALVFPCTPPWYEAKYGLAPAHYGMPGSPAGLARVDKLLGFDMYTTSFSTAPVPFGAFPSLHAADSTLEALFMSFCFPRFRALFIGYAGWLWWATMYLNHHYAVDLVAGGMIASVFFFTARARYLPRQQHDKRNRWQYAFVEKGEMRKESDEELGYSLGLLERRDSTDSDEWSLGSSSGYSSTVIGEGSSGSSSPLALADERRSGDSQHWEPGVSPRGNDLRNGSITA